MINIFNIIVSAMIEASDLSESEINEDTSIFGKGSSLDSLGLVTLLVSIEQKIEDEMSVNITIADEKAMSLKNSPFRTIGTLKQFLEDRLNIHE